MAKKTTSKKKASTKKSSTKKKASSKKAPASQGGPDAALPNAEEMEQAFGVDKSKFDVRAHHDGFKQSSIGTEANAAKLGAGAYTTGNEIAFKKDPSLHTAAHEAAHVVQQRASR